MNLNQEAIIVEIKRLKVASFAVLGLLGSTGDGERFVQHLWKHVNERFDEIKHLALKENGRYVAFWGLMSDFEMNFMPWKDFHEGYYLAGVEVDQAVDVPQGWTKWIFPSCEYVVVKVDDEYQACMAKGLDYLKEHQLKLEAAIVDFMDPRDGGQPYIYFPTKRV